VETNILPTKMREKTPSYGEFPRVYFALPFLFTSLPHPLPYLELLDEFGRV
jgi:hypothetical protein